MNSWDEPDERQRPSGFGGDWRGSRPSFDEPMSWAVRFFTVAGVTVRIHLFFFVFVLVLLAISSGRGPNAWLGMQPTLLGLAALFTVVLLHEFGHVIACRAKGGTADEILIWPLGGLATCTPPERADAHLWTAIGGPLVNVVLIAVLTPTVGLMFGEWWGTAIPNPLGLATLLQREEIATWWQMLIVLGNFVSWALLLFNLIPMFPLDGGRILQAILWKRRGRAPSLRIACQSGLIGAVALGVAALVANSTMLLAIALFGGLVCHGTRRQLDLEREFLGFEPDASEFAEIEEELSSGPKDARGGISGRVETKAESRARAQQAASEAELDRILDKIARSGIESLTEREREALQRATDEKRGRGGP